MRLRNRMVKATFYTDPDLLRWHRDKRHFYQSLWALAEDSYCLEDDMFAVKIAAWQSPLDASMSVKKFETWRNELVDAGKLIPYETDGKRCLFVDDMRKHERPSNPSSADLPLPDWIQWIPNERDPRKGKYVFLIEPYCAYVTDLQERCPTIGQPSKPSK